MTPSVLAHFLAHGRFMPSAIPVRHEPGIPLRCHLTVRDRWRERPGSQAYFGFGLYPYLQSYWWQHSWLIDRNGTLIDSADRDENTRYFGVEWNQELLDAVQASREHPFEDVLMAGLGG